MPPRIEGKPALKAGSLKDVTLDLEGLKKAVLRGDEVRLHDWSDSERTDC